MRIVAWAAGLLALVSLVGCATPKQDPIALAGDYFKPGGQTLAVAMSELPKPDTAFPGADCLLCLAAASVANSAMTDAVRTWPVTDLSALPGELGTALKARGVKVVQVDKGLAMKDYADRKSAEAGFARRDFTSLRASTGAEKLLVVHIEALGVWRNYAAYVPTGAPQATIKGEAYIVDLGTHKLDWFLTLDISRGADGAWDEPPKFPGMGNAYFQVIEQAKDAVKKALAQ